MKKSGGAAEAEVDAVVMVVETMVGAPEETPEVVSGDGERSERSGELSSRADMFREVPF